MHNATQVFIIILALQDVYHGCLGGGISVFFDNLNQMT